MEPLLAELGAGTRLWRGHALRHAGDEFNPTASLTRFTPIAAPEGGCLAYVYAGENEDVAIAETVLHDVPVHDPAPVVLAAKLETMALSELELERSVVLVDLCGHGLRRVRASQRDLTDTGPESYARTAAMAHALLDAAPRAEGLLYPSRQFGGGRCAVIYRRRRGRPPFRRLQTLPLAAGRGRELVDLACDRAAVTVVR